MDAPSRLSTLMARSAAMNAVVEAMAGGSSQEQHAGRLAADDAGWALLSD
jgi:hypothetical protein